MSTNRKANESSMPTIARGRGTERAAARMGSGVRRAAIRRIISSYGSPVIRAYSRIRFMILRQPFLEEIGQYLPEGGEILDLGCGFGLFSLYFAMLAPRREITGIDIDTRRIGYARRSAAALGLTNASYEACDVLEWHAGRRFDAVYMLDLVHHLPAERVPGFLAAAAALLKPLGVLVVKDVAPTPRWKMWFTLLLDRLMVGGDPIHYWQPSELRAVLHGLGLDVKTHRMTDVLPYPHLVYVCRRLD